MHPENHFRIYSLSELLKNQTNSIGCFAGAGVSIPYGMPTWNSFLENAELEIGGNGVIKEAMDNWDLPKAAQLLEDFNKSKFEEIITATFSHKKIESKLVGTGSIFPFLPFQYIVTTNFDYVIEGIYQISGHALKPVIYGANPKFAFSAKKEGLLPLLKIHGDYLNERILTTEQYKQSYSEESPLFNHLIELFSSISFIFIGFSFQDRKIKDALQKARKTNPSIQHFVILPLKAENEIVAWEEEFSELGVLPIWYEGLHTQVEKLLGFLANLVNPDLDLWKIGFVLKWENDWEEVLPTCQNLLKVRPNCHATKKAYSYCLANSIDFGKIRDVNYVHQAIGRIDRAIGIVNEFPDAYVIRAWMNIFRYNIDWAIQDLTIAIEQNSSLKEQTRAMRGMYLMMFKRDMENARIDFYTAIENLQDDEAGLKAYIKFFAAFIDLIKGDTSALQELKNALNSPDFQLDKKTLNGYKIAIRCAEFLKKIGLLKILIYIGSKTGWISAKLISFHLWLGRAGLLKNLYKSKSRRNKKKNK